MFCRDCKASGFEPHELTVEDVQEHAEAGGFSAASSSALSLVGGDVCPECHSFSILNDDEVEPDDLELD